MKRLVAILLVIVMCLGNILPGIADTIHIPAGVKVIGEESFYGDTSLDEVVVPEGVETIGDRAFANSSLNSISLPESINSIGDDAFPNLAVISTPEESYAYYWAKKNRYEIYEDEAQIDIISQGAVNYNSHSYRIFDEYYTWDQAKAQCEMLGGHLLVISNQAEQDFIEQYVLSNGARIVYWIGYNCESENDSWKWVNGETVSYQPTSCLFDYWGPAPYAAVFLNREDLRGNWADLQYDGYISGDTSGLWNSYSNFGFICEWDTMNEKQLSYERMVGLIQDGEILSSPNIDSLKLSLLSEMQSDGIQDEAFLSIIRDYNDLVGSTNIIIAEYNDYINQLEGIHQSIENTCSDFSIIENDVETQFVINGITLRVDNAILGDEGIEPIADVDFVGDSLKLITEGGDSFFIDVTTEEILIAKENSNLIPRGDSEPSAAWENTVQLYTTGTVEADLAYLADGSAFYISNAEREVNALNKQIDACNKQIKTLGEAGDKLGIAGEKGKIAYCEKEIQKLTQNVEENVPKLEGLRAFSAGLTTMSTVKTNQKIARRFAQTNEIYMHKHPTQNDKTQTAISLSDQMRDKIRKLWCLYATEFVVGTVGTVGELVALMGTPVASKIVDILVSAGNSLIDVWADNLYNDVIHIESLLHTYVRGVVKDKDTEELLSNVIVFTDEANTRSEGSGFYRLYLPYEDSVPVYFTKDGYEKNGLIATLSVGKSIEGNIELKKTKQNGKILGAVYDENRNTIANAHVVCGDMETYTDDNGLFEIAAPEGTYIINAYKAGYLSDLSEQPVNVVELNNTIVAITINKKDASIVSGRVVNKLTENGIQGVKVTFGLYSTVTDSNGYYEITLKYGNYQYRFECEGFKTEKDSYSCIIHDETTDIGGVMTPDGDGVPIDAEHFPDRNFRNYIYIKRYDLNEDGFLNKAEIANVTQMVIGYPWNIFETSFEGIQYFRSLKTLEMYNIRFNNNSNPVVDLRNMYSLEYVHVEGCFGFINLNDCINLKGFSSTGSLYGVSVEGCTSLEYFRTSSSYENRLELSNHPALKEIYCDNAGLISLVLTGCTALEVLDCHSNNLEMLDISSCSNLYDLNCSNNALRELNVNGLNVLKTLDCSFNLLSTLNLSGHTKLTSINCTGNQISNLNVAGTDPWMLRCSINNISVLDLRNIVGHSYLYKLEVDDGVEVLFPE